MDEKSKHHIVANGRRQVLHDEIERIRREVREQYAKELAEAGFLRRWVLWRRIRKEIAARLDEVAPQGGIYARR